MSLLCRFTFRRWLWTLKHTPFLTVTSMASRNCYNRFVHYCFKLLYSALRGRTDVTSVMYGNSSSWRRISIHQRWLTSSFSKVTLVVSSKWVPQSFSARLRLCRWPSHCNHAYPIPLLCSSKLRCQKTVTMKIPMKCLDSSPCWTLQRGR